MPARPLQFDFVFPTASLYSMQNNPHERLHVVIVGGGLGGLYAAKGLRNAQVDVTLIDRRNFHLFQPLLYQVATGGLSLADIAFPLRRLFRHHNVPVLMGEVEDIDVRNRCVQLENQTIPFGHTGVASAGPTGCHTHRKPRGIEPGWGAASCANEFGRRLRFAGFNQ